MADLEGICVAYLIEAPAGCVGSYEPQFVCESPEFKPTYAHIFVSICHTMLMLYIGISKPAMCLTNGGEALSA